jgi:hypothetical protein
MASIQPPTTDAGAAERAGQASPVWPFSVSPGDAHALVVRNRMAAIEQAGGDFRQLAHDDIDRLVDAGQVSREARNLLHDMIEMLNPEHSTPAAAIHTVHDRITEQDPGSIAYVASSIATDSIRREEFGEAPRGIAEADVQGAFSGAAAGFAFGHLIGSGIGAVVGGGFQSVTRWYGR